MCSEKILVGISGGVDSAYVLSELIREGYDVTAAHLIMTDMNSENDDARRCANEAGAPFVSIDCRELFEEKVVTDFVGEYKNARTPNPCVVCNKEVKIHALVKYAEEHGFDRVCTGHYAKVSEGDIYKAVDEKKDQSYMLWMLTKEQRHMLLCPLGNKTKDEVRLDSKTKGLSCADKKDSLDICFIPDGDYAGFIASKGIVLPNAKFLHADGRELGDAKGSIINYTVGQRKGLGLAMDKCVFVTNLCALTNTVTVDYETGIYSNTFKIKNVNIHDENYAKGDLFVKIRYSAKPVKCSIRENGSVFSVTTDTPCKAVTPGQSAVFYDCNGKIMLGGIIE